MNDVVINKIQSLQKCVQRAREEHLKAGEGFGGNYTSQDAALLNILRACEQALDLANYVIRKHKMGIPASSAESFDLLKTRHVISAELTAKMKGMVGFRNVAVHAYQKLDIQKVELVIKYGLDDLLAFSDSIMEYMESRID